VTDTDLLARAQANFFGMYRILAATNDAGSVCERDGLQVAATGVPLRPFNNVFVTRPLQDPASLRDAFASLDSRRLPFRLRVREGTDSAAEDAVLEHGLESIGTIQELALSPLESIPATSTLEIRRVGDDETLQTHADIVAAGFGLSPPLVRQVFSGSLISEPSWHAYVGYADGRPAAASQLVMSDGVAGIYYVATLEDYRRRGFGEAMTWHAVRDGAEAGCDVSVLQASVMGLPIYERMGFAVIGAYKTFALPEPTREEEV
jgi:ribosomal protein S18 acetylase RimI-like enzyme